MNNKFYQECASILSQVHKSKLTLKSAIYNYKIKNPRKYMALLTQIIKHWESYNNIINKLEMPTRNLYLSLIYVHEVLNGNITVDNVITRCIKKCGNNIDLTRTVKTFYFRFSNVVNISEQNCIEMLKNKKYVSITNRDENTEDNYNSHHENSMSTDSIDKNSKDSISANSKDSISKDSLSDDTNSKISKDSISENSNTLSKDSLSIDSYSKDSLSKDSISNNSVSMNIKTTNSKSSSSNDSNSTSDSKVLIKHNSDEINDFLESIQAEETFIPYVYKSKHNITTTPFYHSHKLIIQNISSCIPAYLLNPTLNSKVIDSCAAPGNKTFHLASIMQNTGTITAYETDKKRYNTLVTNIKKYNYTNITAHNQNFLDVINDSSVEYILVDPSCSGSGIHDLYVKDIERVNNLATFQKKILKHALHFTNVRKVCYSTCSIHEEENEEVIQDILQSTNNFRLINCKNMLKNVEIVRCGNEKYEFWENVVRVNVDKENNVHGFFVAVFERINE